MLLVPCVEDGEVGWELCVGEALEALEYSWT
jgi:hypothetical protein